MDPTLIALATIGLCLVFILIEMPVALAIGLAGVVGIVLLGDVGLASSTLGAVPYSSSAKYALFAIPTYVLLGCLISNAGIGAMIYRFVNKLVRRLPGGLAATAVLATSVFSGISGSTAADVATFGRISVTEMHRNGYSKPYAAAVVAAAGTFAVLIPPSISLVLYAIIADVSVGAMLMAGVVPGILSGIILAAFVVIRPILSKDASLGATKSAVAVGSSGAGENLAFTDSAIGTITSTASTSTASAELDNGGYKPRGNDAIAVVYAAILFSAVLGGMHTGVFTASEAGAVGAVLATVIAAIVTIGRTSFWKVVRNSLTETAEVTSMIFLLLIGGGIFSYALARSGMPAELAAWVAELSIPPKLILVFILLLLLPLGAFLDGLSVMLLTVPILAPIVLELGFDGIWFGILLLKIVEIGLITPPVGINAFIISSITRAPVEKVYRALLPFVLLDLAVTGVFFLFPDLILWLPRLAGLA